MKKYAIIGASGLIGSHLAKELVATSQVFAFSRSPLNFKHSFLTWVECNLEKECLANRIPKDVDAIIYLAQSEYFRDFPRKTEEVFSVNVQRYLEVLSYAVENKIGNVIYASSGGVYQQKDKHFDEEDDLAPSEELGFYLGSKICAEIISRAFTNLLNIHILRFFFVYGENQKEHMLIPRLIKNIREGAPISLDGKDGVVVNPTHVSDAVAAIQKILNTKNSGIYNVAGGHCYSLREICGIIGRILNISPHFLIKEAPQKKICGDIKKIKEMGWEPKVDLPEGIRQLIDSYGDSGRGFKMGKRKM